jgi:hypothetical protein
MTESIRAKFDQGTPPPGYVDREVVKLTQNGVWLADGKEISHEPTGRLFGKSLRRDETGYFLHIGHEYKRIEVEDTAFFVSRIDGSAKEGYTIAVSDESREKLDPQTLSYRPGRLTCRVKNGEEEAKFLSAAYFDLLRDLQEDGKSYFLIISGVRVELGRI